MDANHRNGNGRVQSTAGLKADNAGTGHVCSECRHWQAMDERQMRGPIALDQPRSGECHESIVAFPIVIQRPQGLEVVNRLVFFPSPPENFPACGRFQQRTTDGTDDTDKKTPGRLTLG